MGSDMCHLKTLILQISYIGGNFWIREQSFVCNV